MTTRHTTARDLAQIAIFAALIAALGLPGTIPVGSIGVPITLQTLGVMLAGGILGARKGFLAVLIFLTLATAGLPLLANKAVVGFAIWSGPSAGYFVGWLVGVAVIGWLTAKALPAYPLWLGIAINFLGGMLIVYVCGVAVLAFRVGFVPAVTGNFLFLPGDSLKVVVASIVIKQVHRAYPGLIGPPATGEAAADPAAAADTAVPTDSAVPTDTAVPTNPAVPTDSAVAAVTVPADAPATRSARADCNQPADGPTVSP